MITHFKRNVSTWTIIYASWLYIVWSRIHVAEKRRIWGTYIILILNYNQNKIKLGCSIFKCTSNLLRLCVYYYPIFFPLKSLFSFSGQLLSGRGLEGVTLDWVGNRLIFLSRSVWCKQGGIEDFEVYLHQDLFAMEARRANGNAGKVSSKFRIYLYVSPCKMKDKLMILIFRYWNFCLGRYKLLCQWP